MAPRSNIVLSLLADKEKLKANEPVFFHTS